MRLLQTEIDANPAATPTVQPNLEGRVGMNDSVAVLDLANASESENNFWIWVRAARPEDAWLERLCRLEALGAVHGVQDNLENGKYKAYVRHRESRQITIKVAAPPQPESRSGVYDMVATVQSQVPLRVGGEERSLFEFPFRVAVRPFHRWSLAVEPAETRVRMLRRRAILWATVENSGNDWLYVDLKLPKEANGLAFERDAERIAVPPAPSAKEPSVRRVPIHLRSRHRGVRGGAIRVPVPLAATRVDAPTVARFPSTDRYVASLNLSSPVLIEPSNDAKTAGAEVAYYPPIPATLTDFVTSLRTSLMTVISLFLMGAAAFYAASFLYEHLQHNLDSQNITADPVVPGAPIVIHGSFLQGCDVTVTLGDAKLPITKTGTDSLMSIRIEPPLPPSGTKVKINLMRRGFGLISVPPIFPSRSLEVQIGSAPVAVKTLKLSLKTELKLGETVMIGHVGPDGFGPSGRVFLNEKEVSATWTDEHITLVIPDNVSTGAGIPIRILSTDGHIEGSRDDLHIIDPKAVPSTTGGDVTTATTSGPQSNPDQVKTSGDGVKPIPPKPDPMPLAPAVESDRSKDFAQALSDSGNDAILKAADKAEEEKDPLWREYKVYAGAVAGRRDYYDDKDVLEGLKKYPPAADDHFGQALLLLADAEVKVALKDPNAEASYNALVTYIGETHLDKMKLFKAALDHHREPR